jgi:hypothetical protein
MAAPTLSRAHIDEDVSIHIFSVSAAMVGVCLTVIGILRIVIAVKNVATVADDLLLLDAIVFLTACILAYIALRTTARMHMTEHFADGFFIVGLVLMAVACGFITYAIL